MEPVWGVTIKQMVTEPPGEIAAQPAIGLGSLSPLRVILDGCTLVRALLFHFFLQFPPTLVHIPLVGTGRVPRLPRFPPFLTTQALPQGCPHLSLTPESSGRRFPGLRTFPSTTRVSSFPASRDAGVLPRSVPQPLPERVFTQQLRVPPLPGINRSQNDSSGIGLVRLPIGSRKSAACFPLHNGKCSPIQWVWMAKG